MRIDFAPLEGLVDRVFCHVHCEVFGGVERYFLPFVSPTDNRCFSGRELRLVTPQSGEPFRAVPQILCRDAESFLWAAGALADLGYTEVNFNLGCPSGTVTAKRKGAGFLYCPDELEAFLHKTVGASPIPVSVKTRIGFASPEEFPRLVELFASVPFCEMILHPRTAKEMYRGAIHTECFDLAVEKRLPYPLIYNGDIVCTADAEALTGRYPALDGVMVGRGLIADPALALRMRGNAPMGEGYRGKLYEYHDALFAGYTEQFGGGPAVVGRMKEHWSYLRFLFPGSEKLWKRMAKSHTKDEYLACVTAIFAGCPLLDGLPEQTRF